MMMCMDQMRDTATSDPVTTAEAQDHFAEVLHRAAVGKERVVLTEDGRPLAALVPIEDVEALEAMEDAEDAEIARQRFEEWEREGRPSVTLEEVARRYGIPLGEE